MDASSRSFMRWVVVIRISMICYLSDHLLQFIISTSVAILAKNCFPPSVPLFSSMLPARGRLFFIRHRVEALRRRSRADHSLSRWISRAGRLTRWISGTKRRFRAAAACPDGFSGTKRRFRAARVCKTSSLGHTSTTTVWMPADGLLWVHASAS